MALSVASSLPAAAEAAADGDITFNYTYEFKKLHPSIDESFFKCTVYDKSWVKIPVKFPNYQLVVLEYLIIRFQRNQLYLKIQYLTFLLQDWEKQKFHL